MRWQLRALSKTAPEGFLSAVFPRHAVPTGGRIVGGAAGTLVLALAAALASAPAAEADTFDDLWTDSWTAAGDCGAAFNGPLSDGANCLVGSGIELVMDAGVRFADDYGKSVFGEHFQFIGKATYREGTRFDADLDTVIPLTQSTADGPGNSSIFFQQGVTRSWDSGFGYRNDMRHGVVHRFRVADAPESDIVGVSAFYQHNAEHGHQVFVSALDYAGHWGTGSLRHFQPTTGWRTTGDGYQERALEGMEATLKFAVTTTIGTDLTGYRWQAEDGSDEWNLGTRLGLGWQPHSWFSLNTAYDGGSESEDSMQLMGRVTVPFGGPPTPLPKWDSLGTPAGGWAPGADGLWRPVDGIGRIKVGRRASAADLVGNAEIRFLQDAAATGTTIGLQVVLRAAAAEDIPIQVQLVPGGGPNPAVPGVDFVDEPVETTIRRGQESVTVNIQLLNNGRLQEDRSLDATVTLAS